MKIEYFSMAFTNFRARKMRSWLTILGIFVGIAAVVALISLGQGFQEAINEQFQSIGRDKIFVYPGGGMYGMSGAEVDLTENDVSVVKKANGVQYATGVVYKIGKAEFKDEVKYTWIMGFSLEKDARELINSMQSIKVAQGRNIEKGDKYKVVVGSGVSDGSVFKKNVRLSDKISIEDIEFDVVGIMEPIGNPQDDSSVYLPIETARDIFGQTQKVDMIISQANAGEEPSSVAENMKKDLRKFRNLKKEEEDFEVQTQEELMDLYNVILGMVTTVLIGIAAISLVVGGVGIMNTMYTSVLERTREIGIMKAIGARNSHIAQIFLIESGLLGLVGGTIGVTIGIGISKTIETIATIALKTTLIKAYFLPSLIIGALIFSFVIGSVSGLLPAMQASRMNPVDSLRYE